MIMVMVIIYISLIICGGFFLYSSAFLNIILSSLIVAGVVRNKKLRIEMSWYLISLIVLCISYIIVIIYSVDKGLSAMGIIKFLPVLLFCVLLNVYEVDRKKIAEQLPLCAGVMTVMYVSNMELPVLQDGYGDSYAYYDINGVYADNSNVHKKSTDLGVSYVVSTADVNVINTYNWNLEEDADIIVGPFNANDVNTVELVFDQVIY